ncbi:MAG: DUF362 domain-containing protein [Candidatus Atribacteria bacterium]|nr:DUF362 domain-containing protein [Candidatus Atribacteria bacterium]
MKTAHYTVSVHSDDSIRNMVGHCLKDLGGIEQLIPSNSKILLKPNMVIAEPNSTGATTNPLILDVLIEHLMRTSPREIIIGESSQIGDDTFNAYKVTGIQDVAQKWKVTLLDFKKDHQISIDIPFGKEIRKVLVAETVKNVDYLINLPILKVHSQTKVTIGMKNLKGCLHDKEKSRFHRLDLHQCIADLNTVIIPDLTIVDATLCSFNWELGGMPVHLNTILAGKNTLAVDIIAASMLGYSVNEIAHLQLAAQAGLGPTKKEEIHIISPKKLKEIQPEKNADIIKEPYYHLPELEVIEKGACTSCKGALLAAMRRLEKERQSPSCTILMGQRLRDRECEFAPNPKYGTVNSKKSLVSMGQCCRWVAEHYPAEHIKGCPVKAEDIYRYLKTYC